MSQTIWQVKVYSSSNGTDSATYYFHSKEDVLSSIKTTWSQIPSIIQFENTEDDKVIVTYAEHRNVVAVIAERMQFEILDRPTHF